MPPTLPTGTVSRPSAGAQTFPSESNTDQERVPPRANGSTASQTSSPPTTPRPDLPSTGVVSRREHDLALDRAHERIAELEAENDVLRDYIETQADERRAVIERYERLLDRQQPTGRADIVANGRSDGTSPARQSVLDTVRTAVKRLHSSLASVGRD